jgi:two-component system sensor histidine kinase HydH
MIESEAGEKGISIRADIPSEPWNIFIDADKITQVMLNLYLNAIGAMDRGGTLGVALSMLNNRMVQIDVSDTGEGIDKDNLPRIFDPYFTTKPSGTGLGLAIVYRIIEAHNGEIRVESERGKGTKVSVFLPADSASEVQV